MPIDVKSRLVTALFLVLIGVTPFKVLSQEAGNSHPVRIMFYNTENLFDTLDDSLTSDDDFLPGGLMRWNNMRYRKKINSIGKTIIAAGEWDPPAIAGLCEIENRKVMEDLIYGTALANYGYEFIHEDSPDQRGIDVCLLYRKDMVKILSYVSMIPATSGKEVFASRSVLYAKCSVGGDTVHLYINHWPSRRGGVLAGESHRENLAEMLRESIYSLLEKSNGKSKVILMGDFNCNPEDHVLLSLTSHAYPHNGALVNLSSRLSAGMAGTYKHLGLWETIDQIIISKNIMDCSTGLFTEEKDFSIFSPDFLLRDDPRYPGKTTNPTYTGYRYNGGFSDHLPVITDLRIR